jgi:hypothetical protein
MLFAPQLKEVVHHVSDRYDMGKTSHNLLVHGRPRKTWIEAARNSQQL